MAGCGLWLDCRGGVEQRVRGVVSGEADLHHLIMSPLFELGAGILQGEEWTEQVTACEPAKVAQELLDYWCTQKAL